MIEFGSSVSETSGIEVKIYVISVDKYGVSNSDLGFRLGVWVLL